MKRNKRGFTSRRHPELDSGSSRIFNKGFTLLEVLVVVIIIAVLAAVALPQYQKAVWKSRSAEAKLFAGNLVRAEAIYFLHEGQYTDDFSKMDIKL